jgi:hypothetical protein
MNDTIVHHLPMGKLTQVSRLMLKPVNIQTTALK